MASLNSKFMVELPIRFVRKMLDIKLIRETPDVVRSNLEKRGNPENIKLFEELIALDKQWRANLSKLNDFRHNRKVCTTEIATLKKAGKDATENLTKARAIDAEITGLEKEVAREEERTHQLLLTLPNLMHETVPFGKDDHDNVQVKNWGTIPQFSFPVKNHIDLATALDIVDVERAGKIAGARFFFFKGAGVLLDMALMNFALEEMNNKGYTLIEPPYFMNRQAYEGVTSLGDFADVLYKIENEDLFLIATSEHPMAAMYMNEVFKLDNLPLKLSGLSTCSEKKLEHMEKTLVAYSVPTNSTR